MQGGHGGRQSPCDIDVDASAVVTDEKSNERVGKDGPEVVMQSEEVSVFVVHLEPCVEYCGSDGGARCNGFLLSEDYPIGGCCVDVGYQCVDAVFV